MYIFFFFFSSRRRHTRCGRDWSSDVCSSDLLFVKGRGMMVGISCPDGDTAAAICAEAFERGLVIETSGNHSQVVKCLCPLMISEEQIHKAMDILDAAFAKVMAAEVQNRASRGKD